MSEIEAFSRTLTEFLGRELFRTSWFQVSEAEQTAFMNNTGLTPDVIEMGQPRSMVFEGIVEGFYLMSLLPGLHFAHSPLNSGNGWGLNYGVDRARFIRPAFLTDRFRVAAVLTEFSERDGGFVAHLRNTFEIDRGEVPTAVIDWLSYYPTSEDARERILAQRPGAVADGQR